VSADTIAVDAVTTGTTTTTSSNSGIEVTADGIRLLGGCGDTDLLVWDDATQTWYCEDLFGTGLGALGGGGAENQVAFWQGPKNLTGSNSFWWDSAQSRLGIGTSNPVTTLDIAGTAWLRGASTKQGLYVDSNGNVGIGYTSPQAFLDVAGATTSQASVKVRAGVAPSSPTAGDIYSDGDQLFYYNGVIWQDLAASGLGTSGNAGSGVAGQVTFWSSVSSLTGNSNLWWDNSGGNLGIGTSDPSYNLDVAGSANVTNLFIAGSQITASATEINLLDGRTGTLLDSNNVGTYALTSLTAGSGLTGGTGPGATTIHIGAGNGLTVSADSITLDTTTTGTTSVTSNNSGLEVTSEGLRLLGGCQADEILKWNATSSYWYCATDSTGSAGSATIAGSGAATQIAFFTGSTAISGSNNLWWDNTNSRLGIRTSSPSGALEIVTAPTYTTEYAQKITVTGGASGTEGYAYALYNTLTADIDQGEGTSGRAYGIYNSLNGSGYTYGTYANLYTGMYGTSYANYVITDTTSSGTQYAYYANMLSGTGTKWGLYINGESDNYLSGNLGIGDSSPTAWLDISGATTSKPSIRVASGTAPSSPVTGDIYNDGDQLYYYNGSTWQDLGATGTAGTATIAGSGSATQIAFFTGSTAISGSNNLWWDNTGGNLGIGTSDPTAKLMLAGSADTEQFVIKANATQSNNQPLIQLQSSTGTPLLSLHSDNQTNIFLGYSAGIANSIGGGLDNTFIGYLAGSSNTIGDRNTAIGSNTLTKNTTGFENVAVGYQALFNNTTGDFNTALGYQSMYTNVDGGSNIALGHASLYSNYSGGLNVAIGQNALYSNYDGFENIAIGTDSLQYNAYGHQNVAIGKSSMLNGYDANDNTALGYGAGYDLQTGYGNVFLGAWAGDGVARSGSDYNIAIGYGAGASLSFNSDKNIFIGYEAGFSEKGSNTLYIENSRSGPTGALIYGDFASDLLTFNANVGIGITSPTAWLDISGATTAKPSIRVASGTAPSTPVTGDIYNDGDQLYYYNGSSWVDLGTTGTGTIAGSGLATQIAFFSASTAISGSNNLWWDSANSNLGIGTSDPTAKLMLAGSADTEQFVIKANGTQSNIQPLIQLQDSTGTPLLSIHSDDQTNIFMGYGAGIANSVGGGLNNTFIGYLAGSSNTTADSNVALGSNALSKNTTGNQNTALGQLSLYSNTEGYYNTGIGLGSLRSNTTGAYNTAVGLGSLFSTQGGNYNTALGYYAGYANQSGGGNLFMGYYAGYNETGSNKLYIDNGSAPAGSAFIYGDMGTDQLTFNANVGIGITNPAAWLDIMGSTTAKASLRLRSGTEPSTPATGDIYNSGTALYYYNGSAWVDLGTTGTATIAGSGAATQIAFFTGSTAISGSNNLWWDNSNSRLGIGTSTPTATLSVAGGTASTITSTSGPLTITPNTNLILSSGNMGIGETNPLGKLVVKGSDDTEQFIIKANSTQSNANPLIRLQTSSGTELLGITSDDQTNAFMGYRAGSANTVAGTSGQLNTFIGYIAGSSNATGYNNTAIGAESLQRSTTAYENTALGQAALYYITTGYQNTAVGKSAVASTTTGIRNVGIGSQALYGNSDGWYNTGMGYEAGYYSQTGYGNTFLGYRAGRGTTWRTLSSYNVVIGYDAGQSLSYNSDNNIFIGNQAGYSETGSNTLYIDNTSNPASSAFIYGNMSTDVLTFNANVGIGTTAPTNTLDVNGSARFRSVGTSNVSNVPLYITSTGILSTSSSDERLKSNITTIEGAVDKVMQLRGVTFDWAGDGVRATGMIAQEVLNVMPELVFQSPIDGYYGIRYGETSGLLIEATKELNTKLVALKTDFDNYTLASDGSAASLAVESDTTLTQINTLETDVTTLETEVANLKSEVASIQELLAMSTPESTESSSTVPDTPEGILAEMYTLFDEFKSFIASLSLSTDGQTLTAAADFNVLGETTLSNLTITGDINAGLMKIDTLNNVFEVAGPSCYNELLGTTNTQLCADQTLYLQKSLAGNVDILNGGLVVNPDGNVTVKGTLIAEKVEATDVATENVTILAASKTIGSGIIPAGQTEVAIDNTLITSTSKIFITATSSTGGQAVIVKGKVEGASFTVAVDNSVSSDITFDWWVVNMAEGQ